MKLLDVLNPEELFHPKLFYDGEWLLGGEFIASDPEEDYLLLNAKKVKGKNAYQEFLEGTYYRSLQNALDSASLSKAFFPKIALTVDSSGEKREVRFDIVVFLYQQLLGVHDKKGACERFGNFATEHEDIHERIAYIKEELKKDRKIYCDIRENGTKSSYYGDFYQLYLDYIRYSKNMMTFIDFLDGKINGITKLLVGSRYYLSVFEKEIPTDKLLEAFDYDTFCLIAARSALDCCRTTEQIDQKVNNAIGYVHKYLEAVSRLRIENPNYDCTMVLNGSHKKTNIQEIQEEYEAILSRHPEFSFIETNEEEIENLLRKDGLDEESIQGFDMSTRSNQETLSSLLLKLRADKELAAEWEFIPKGTASDELSSIQRGISSPSMSISESEKIRRMLIGREFLENSGYAYKIYGVNKFKGYVGYIYPNKNVIFEKYYENDSTKKVASSSATYVMDLYNFMELSKLSKTEIIRIIRADRSANIKRIYHQHDMDKWKSRIEQVLSGSDYNEDVMAYIDALISHNSLKKSEVKK